MCRALLFLTLAISCGCAHGWAIPPRQGEQLQGTARAIDGDTIEMIVRGYPVRIRLLGIDTPERGEAGWAQAKAEMAGKLANRPIKCTIGPRPRDAFGRILAACEIHRLFLWLHSSLSMYPIRINMPPSSRWRQS
jgi:endonuclease YncB( thermonuclease family)